MKNNDVQLDEEVRKAVKSGKGVRVLELGTFCGYGGRLLSSHTHIHTHTHTYKYKHSDPRRQMVEGG